MSDAPIKRKRGRPNGSFKKPQARKIFKRMPPQDKLFLQEARDGELYPIREHKVVERACAAIEKETGIVVAGDAKILLYAAYQSLVAWTIHDHGLGGLYGLPSTRTPGMAKGKRRAQVFQYLKFSFEKATDGAAPKSCNKKGVPFFRFARVALLIIAPPNFLPGLDKPVNKTLSKAIENALTPWSKILKKRLKNRYGPLAVLANLTVKFPGMI